MVALQLVAVVVHLFPAESRQSRPVGNRGGTTRGRAGDRVFTRGNEEMERGFWILGWPAKGMEVPLAAVDDRQSGAGKREQ